MISSTIALILAIATHSQSDPTPISKLHTSAVVDGQRIEILGITDPVRRISWDLSGHLLPKMVFTPNSDPSGVPKTSSHVKKKLFLIVRMAGPLKLPYEPTLNIYGANGTMIFYRTGQSNTESAIFRTTRAYELQSSPRARRVDLLAKLANGPRRTIGEIQSDNGATRKKGFDFHPQFAIDQSGTSDVYFVVRPPHSGNDDVSIQAFSVEGKPTSVGWYLEKISRRVATKPFGSGSVKRLVMSTRPYKTIRILDVPLRPSR